MMPNLLYLEHSLPMAKYLLGQEWDSCELRGHTTKPKLEAVAFLKLDQLSRFSLVPGHYLVVLLLLSCTFLSDGLFL